MSNRSSICWLEEPFSYGRKIERKEKKMKIYNRSPPARLKVQAFFPSAPEPAARPEKPTCPEQPALSGLTRLAPAHPYPPPGLGGLREPSSLGTAHRGQASVYLLHLLSGLLVHGFLIARRLLLRQRGGGPKWGLWQVLQVHLGWWDGGWRTRLGQGLDRRNGERSSDWREGNSPGLCTLQEHRQEAPTF